MRKATPPAPAPDDGGDDDDNDGANDDNGNETSAEINVKDDTRHNKNNIISGKCRVKAEKGGGSRYGNAVAWCYSCNPLPWFE